MNERILELANKANEDVGFTFKMEDARKIHELMEKFAELIVKECANFIDSHEQVDKYGEAMNIVHGEDLIKHFGVRE